MLTKAEIKLNAKFRNRNLKTFLKFVTFENIFDILKIEGQYLIIKHNTGGSNKFHIFQLTSFKKL